jgi:hypothetical protein
MNIDKHSKKQYSVQPVTVCRYNGEFCLVAGHQQPFWTRKLVFTPKLGVAVSCHLHAKRVAFSIHEVHALSHLIMSTCLDLYKFVVLQFMTMKPKGYGNSLW